MVTEFVKFCANRGYEIPDELVDEYLDLKEGDVVRVTKEGSHRFKVGEIVQIKRVGGAESFCCISESDYWWLGRSEFEKI